MPSKILAAAKAEAKAEGYPPHKHTLGKGEAPPSPKNAKKADISIKYFNVGQGNCVLMQNHNEKKAVLVDCGSTEHGKRPGSKPKVVLEDIKGEIEDAVAQATKGVLVIVTHMDIDHYNNIQKMVETVHNKDPELLKFIVASHTPLDEGSNHFIEWVGKRLIQIDNIEALQDTLKAYKLTGWIKPLAAVAGDDAEVKQDVAAQVAHSKNADSIVIMADTGKCSALLTGDANEASAVQIAHEKGDPHTTVLLASHHGASSDGSNSEEWVKKTSPKAVIISAGDHSYAHPRCEAVEHYLASKNLVKDGPHHKLTCFKSKGEDREDVPEFPGTPAIYSTYDQGNIELELYENEFTIRAPLDKDMKGGGELTRACSP